MAHLRSILAGNCPTVADAKRGKTDDSLAISAHIVINVPVFVVIVVFSLVVWSVVSILVERVLDAFVENLFGVIRSIRTFCPRNGVMKAKVAEERWEIVQMVLDIELLIEKMLNLLFLLGLSLTETLDESLLFGFIELRGPAAPEVRS